MNVVEEIKLEIQIEEFKFTKEIIYRFNNINMPKRQVEYIENIIKSYKKRKDILVALWNYQVSLLKIGYNCIAIAHYNNLFYDLNNQINQLINEDRIITIYDYKDVDYLEAKEKNKNKEKRLRKKRK